MYIGCKVVTEFTMLAAFPKCTEQLFNLFLNLINLFVLKYEKLSLSLIVVLKNTLKPSFLPYLLVSSITLDNIIATSNLMFMQIIENIAYTLENRPLRTV